MKANVIFVVLAAAPIALNASQDTLLLSDRNLEPNIMRGLIEMGDWRPVD